MYRLLIELALRTGGRASEILALTKADLNAHEQTVFLKGLKGSNDREIPLSGPLFKRLSLYAENLPRQKIFNISYRQFNRVWEMYRPVPKKLHSLRHTFAIELYKKHRDLRLVQVALGHRNIQNTMVYAEYHYATTELRKLIC